MTDSIKTKLEALLNSLGQTHEGDVEFFRGKLSEAGLVVAPVEPTEDRDELIEGLMDEREALGMKNIELHDCIAELEAENAALRERLNNAVAHLRIMTLAQEGAPMYATPLSQQVKEARAFLASEEEGKTPETTAHKG